MYHFLPLTMVVCMDDTKYTFFKFILFIFDCAGSSSPHELFSSFGKQGLLSSCNAQASHCGGFSCCRAWALELVGFRSYSTWAQQLWLPGSRAQAQ